MSAPRFRSVMTTPPGGEFFFEHEGERVSARNWPEMLFRMRDLMARHKLDGVPEVLVAEYMCPHMPDWYCTSGGVHRLSISEVKDNAEPYFGRNIVDFETAISRMQTCTSCPMHRRHFCLTCTGLVNWIRSKFGGRRPNLPTDAPSGTCECAKTFEAVVCSVDYGKDDPVWENAPKTCWRCASS